MQLEERLGLTAGNALNVRGKFLPRTDELADERIIPLKGTSLAGAVQLALAEERAVEAFAWSTLAIAAGVALILAVI
jgi:hypothetical protein